MRFQSNTVHRSMLIFCFYHLQVPAAQVFKLGYQVIYTLIYMLLILAEHFLSQNDVLLFCRVFVNI